MTEPVPAIARRAVAAERAGYGEPDGSAELAQLRELAAADPALYTLAQALCLVPYATTAFVRRARLEFVPASAVGLEADLWFSPLVESADARAVVLDPLYAAGMRHELVRDRARWRAVCALTEELQREAPELVRRYTRLALADAGVPDADAGAELAGFADAIAAGAPDDTSAEDLARWLVHFLPRLPRVLAAGPLARALLISAATRLAVDPPQWVLDRHGPAGVAAARAAVRGHVELGVRFDDDGLVLSRPPESGSRVLEVPGGERVRVELAGPGEAVAHGYPVEVGATETVRVPVAVFAELPATTADQDLRTGRRLINTEVVFGASGVLADGHLRAVLRRSRNGPELDLRHDTVRRTVQLRGSPRLLRADDRSGTVLLATGETLTVVRTQGQEVTYFGGMGQIRDAVVATPRPSSRTLWVIVANEHGVCVLRADAPAEPPTFLSRSAEPGLRIWVNAELSELVIVSGRADPQVIDLASGDPIRYEAPADALPVTAITSGRGGRPLLYAQTGPQLVLMPTPDATHVVRGGGLTSDIASLAISRGGGSRTAGVDREGRLLRWDGPGMSGHMREVPLLFRAVSVSAASLWAFTVVGRGGPIELRDRDGRSMLLTPSRPEPDTGWLLDTLVGTMPTGPAVGAHPESLRRAGIDCVRVLFPMDRTQPVRIGSDAASGFLRTAGAVGVKVLVELPVEPASDEIRRERTPGLLRRCAELLAAGAAGVCVSVPPASEGIPNSTVLDLAAVEFLRSLRRLVDEHPGRVLVLDRGASDDSISPAGDECCHLVLDRGSRSWRRASARLAAGEPIEHAASNWAVELGAGPEEDPAHVCASASIALALPGLRAVAEPPRGPASEAVAALLRARRRERALTRGTVTRLGSSHADVIALLRRYEDEFVVCVANLGPRRATVALTTPSLPPGSLVDLLDLAGPSPPRTHGGGSPTMIPLAPDEYRWFRLLTTDELYASRP
ncbi:hypothetical protein [Embleya sp. NPDC005575]|uniref:hypothetical protein n=1 Tax=Embleya sp. NPDC005575 TaxID=3156892 RepID=UPI0033AD75A1